MHKIDALKELKELLDERKFEECLFLSEDIMNSTRNKPYLLYLRSQCYSGLNQHDQAVLELKEALKLEPKGGNYHGALASCYVEMGKGQINKDDAKYHEFLDLALECLKESLARGATKNHRTWNSLGDISVLKGDYEVAKEYYDKAIGIADYDWWAYNGKGLIFQKEGNYAKSLEHFDKAIECLNKILASKTEKTNLDKNGIALQQVKERREECKKMAESSKNGFEFH